MSNEYDIQLGNDIDSISEAFSSNAITLTKDLVFRFTVQLKLRPVSRIVFGMVN
jgi:hypothetical protein